MKSRDAVPMPSDPRTVRVEDVPVICQRYMTGESSRAIGETYGVCHHTIRSRLIGAGIPMRPRSWQPQTKRLDEHLDEMAAAYIAGESALVLAEKYGVSHRTICDRLEAKNIPRRGAYACRPGGPLHTERGRWRTYGRNQQHCLVHRGCWEAYHGSIPDGYIIHHVDGDGLNNEIGNLACMTQVEHMRIHHPGERNKLNGQFIKRAEERP